MRTGLCKSNWLEHRARCLVFGLVILVCVAANADSGQMLRTGRMSPVFPSRSQMCFESYLVGRIYHDARAEAAALNRLKEIAPEEADTLVNLDLSDLRSQYKESVKTRWGGTAFLSTNGVPRSTEECQTLLFSLKNVDIPITEFLSTNDLKSFESEYLVTKLEEILDYKKEMPLKLSEGEEASLTKEDKHQLLFVRKMKRKDKATLVREFEERARPSLLTPRVVKLCKELLRSYERSTQRFLSMSEDEKLRSGVNIQESEARLNLFVVKYFPYTVDLSGDECLHEIVSKTDDAVLFGHAARALVDSVAKGRYSWKSFQVMRERLNASPNLCTDAYVQRIVSIARVVRKAKASREGFVVPIPVILQCVNWSAPEADEVGQLLEQFLEDDNLTDKDVDAIINTLEKNEETIPVKSRADIADRMRVGFEKNKSKSVAERVVKVLSGKRMRSNSVILDAMLRAARAKQDGNGSPIKE